MTELLLGECVEVMRTLPAASIDAVISDPPYGLEFMGKDWDRLDGEGWRTGGGFSSPGIGDRPTAWVSFGQGDTANATCATCGGRMRGANRCACKEPDWRVKGQPLGEAEADSRAAQGRKMQAWHQAWATEAFRVLKPGGHLLAFGGTRTYHRLACAVEDAGFEIRDCVMWLYGSGFPKSLDVSKAIDAHRGVERTEVVGVKAGHEDFVDRTDDHAAGGRAEGWDRAWRDDPEAVTRSHMRTAPATPEAEQWDGWGTALKPAYEPILVARKPLAGTVAGNVLAHGVGALNIDASRIAGIDPANAVRLGREYGDGESSAFGQVTSATVGGSLAGRWPTNVILAHSPDCVLVGERTVPGDARDNGDALGGERPGGFFAPGSPAGTAAPSGRVYGEQTVEVYECVEGCPIRILDAQSGEQQDGIAVNRRRTERAPSPVDITPTAVIPIDVGYGGAGGASRFFYCAKVSSEERNRGCEHLDARAKGAGDGAPVDNSLKGPTNALRPDQATVGRNNHPTVKPIDLMRYLIRLVVPKGATILDPFLGSGTTALAAYREHIECIGIERDPGYMQIAQARWDAETAQQRLEL